MAVQSLARIVPDGVSVAVARADVDDLDLFPEEEAAVCAAVESRRREFATGRACAREALAQLGVFAQAIPVGPAGEPRWPAGIVASLTHCAGYRACAAARASDLASIGIDAEPNRPLPGELLGDLAFGDEPAQLHRLSHSEPEVCWDRLLFSAKESVYKAWFQLTGQRLAAEGVALDFEPRTRAFTARVLAPGLPPPTGTQHSLSGGWTIDDGIALTAIAVAQAR